MQDKLIELLDKQAIAEAIYRYAESIDRRDPELMASAFTPDAQLHLGVGMYEGPASELVGQWQADRPTDFLVTHHQVGNIQIEFDGPDRAHVSTYLTAVHRARRRGQLVDEVVRARYLDVFVKLDERWLIEERTLVYDWS